MRRQIGLFLGPLLLIAVLLSPAPPGMEANAWRTAAVAVLMATWWVTEAIPIPATALTPLVAFPLLGIAPINAAAAPYANPVIFLFMGGFMIASALEGCGLHKRIALTIISWVGTRPANLVAGFMAATAFLSMWVSNTATVVMMLPVALSILALAEMTPDKPASPHLPVALLLGIAYAANIGGIGTLIGTPPNALLAGFLSTTFGRQIGFAEWMMFGVPLVAVALPLCWLLLVKILYPVGTAHLSGSDIIAREVRSMGRISPGEMIVGGITACVALAWVFQPVLGNALPGLSDAGIAIAGALLLFLVPVRLRPLKFALDWSRAERLPWAVLILFGGGLSLAGAIQDTGLAAWIGSSLQWLRPFSPILVALAVTTVIVFLTELTSNTATAAAFLPVAASLAIAMAVDPLLLAIPTAVGASCAFMMPVATPPNAIVYGSGRIAMPQMVKAGLWLNIILILLINLLTMTLARFVFGF
ncbi:DASS family sodium-coupled anion symporter [soil metagenome]